MHQEPSPNWIKNNQKYLASCIGQIKTQLEAYRAYDVEDRGKISSGREIDDEDDNNNSHRTYSPDPANGQMQPPEWSDEKSLPAVDVLCSLFRLSEFERSIILLCAGVELFEEFAKLCAKAQGTSDSPYPTLGLAMSLFPDAHWDAILPVSPLRYYRLIELFYAGKNGLHYPTTIAESSVRLDERVLHYLTGISYLDPQLHNVMKQTKEIGIVVDSHKSIVENILSLVAKDPKGRLPIINLWGIDTTGKTLIAQQICAKLGLNLWQLSATDLILSKSTEDVDSFVQLWARESLLLHSGLYIQADEIEELSQQQMIIRLTNNINIKNIALPIFFVSRDRWSNNNENDSVVISVEVKKPTRKEQLYLWKALLLSDADEHHFSLSSYSSSSPISTRSHSSLPNDIDQGLKKLVDQFDMSTSTILSASREAMANLSENSDISEALWNASLSITRSKISKLGLVQRISSTYSMDDLVLPTREQQLLKDIVIHVRQRAKVNDEWGFGLSNRGGGIIALFSGASGTGKTMAAEVLSNELRLDLYRADISSIVSKYIGETEKNLRKVFDAAEDGGAILFFDEADALFGKRAEVRDSHDRYANIEINYLLQRIESYRGLAILATNMKNAIDSAFMRRIRFVVDFPFPDEQYREKIWKNVFPSSAPKDDNTIDFRRLARLNISGGNIRNIAVYAAFLAADEGVPISMKHLKHAAEVEHSKIDRSLTRGELLGEW